MGLNSYMQEGYKSNKKNNNGTYILSPTYMINIVSQNSTITEQIDFKV